MTDELQRQLADDLNAGFPMLVDTYGTLVLTIATRLTDAATGEDITQEAFLRAYRALASYESKHISNLDLRPWLATITRNLVRNEYRRRERKPALSLEAGNHTEPAMRDPEPASHDLDELSRVLVDLTDAQREAVVLRHVVGLPMREVALTMGCPDGTAKSHVSRGLAQLRSTLDQREAHR